MVNSFKQYLVEEERVVYFAFGRMNPPTIGHGKLMDKLASVAGRNPYKLFLSQSNDKKDNPVQYQDKVKHVRKMFPKHARSVMINKKVKTPFDALSALYDEGFRKVIMVAGSDRVQEYDLRLNKYNGKKGAHGFYNFENGVKIVSAGQRDPDAKGAEGASGTKQRGYAADNDFTGFSQGLPKTMSTGDAKRLFNDVRKGMGLKEQMVFKNHVQFEPVSDLRESYVKKELFKLGETVVYNDRVGKVKYLGTNYLIIESKGETWRAWIDAVSKVDPQEEPKYEVFNEEYKYEWGTDAATKHAKKMTPGQKNEGGMKRIATTQSNKADRMASGGKKGLETFKKKQEAQDPDIKDRKGTQPARYHTGLSKATKIARDRHFQARKPGPAPGDANAKTIPSKHTTFVRKMMGEESVNVNMAKKRIDREKEMDKARHDRMLDRARTKDTKQKNMQTEASFADKSKASGISVGTLKKVYQRGVAAWKTGHRPGTNPSQWGHARVNAFIRKKKQGGLNHDKDLA